MAEKLKHERLGGGGVLEMMTILTRRPAMEIRPLMPHIFCHHISALSVVKVNSSGPQPHQVFDSFLLPIEQDASSHVVPCNARR
jgi:hypothetical protein